MLAVPAPRRQVRGRTGRPCERAGWRPGHGYFLPAMTWILFMASCCSALMATLIVRSSPPSRDLPLGANAPRRGAPGPRTWGHARDCQPSPDDEEMKTMSYGTPSAPLPRYDSLRRRPGPCSAARTSWTLSRRSGCVTRPSSLPGASKPLAREPALRACDLPLRGIRRRRSGGGLIVGASDSGAGDLSPCPAQCPSSSV